MNDKVLSIIIKAQDQASKVLDTVGEHASALGGTIGRALKIAGAAMVAGGTAAVGFAVASAASFEQTRIGLENMLGSADDARKVLAQVSQFAAQTPFEFPELASTVKQLVGFGFSGQDAIKTMKQLGDVSAAIGVPIGDLGYLMGTLKTQGRAFTIDIRQFAQRGVPIYEYLAKTLHTTTAEVNNMIEAGKIGFPEVSAAFAAMTAEGGKFHGAMAKQSQSLSGLWSTLKDNIGLAAREMIGITQEGDVKAGSMFDRMRVATAGLITELDKIDWAAVSSKAMDMASAIVSSLSGAAGVVYGLLSPAFQAFADYLNNTVIPAVSNLVSWFSQLDPVVQLVLSPIGALILNFTNLGGYISQVITEVQALWAAFTQLTPVIIIGQYFQQVLFPALQAIWAAVVQNLVPALGQLWDSLTRLYNSLQPGLTTVLQIVASIIGGVLAAVIWEFLRELNIIIQVISMVISVISNLINWISNLISWFGNLVGVVINTVATIGSIFGNLIPAVRDVIGVVGSLFAGLGGQILHAVGNFGSLLYDAGRSLIHGLVSGIQDTFGSIGSSISGGIKGALHSAHVPGFATGGYTGRGGTNEVAGIVHRGEYVVPANQVNQETGLPMGMGGATFNMYGSIQLGSKDAVDAFFERLNAQREMAAMGVGV